MMTSADVVPSLQHWAKLGTTPKAVWKSVEAVEAKDPYTVIIYLKEPSGSLLYALGSPNNGGAIYPKEVVAAAGGGQGKEDIRTGPYRLPGGKHHPPRRPGPPQDNNRAPPRPARDRRHTGRRRD